MMTSRAPNPTCVLLAWDEPVSTSLWRLLNARRPAVQTTLASASEIPKHLQARDYYHVLYVPLVHWQALMPGARQGLASRISLIILGPEPCSTIDLEGLRTGVYLTATFPMTQVVAELGNLHARLVQGWTLSQCVAETDGRLALVGSEECWPVTKTAAEGTTSRAEKASDQQNEPIKVDTTQLRQVLTKLFNDSELRDLCFDLKVDYDDLGGETKRDKARELIAFLERRGRISELVKSIRRARPTASWSQAGDASGDQSGDRIQDSNQAPSMGAPSGVHIGSVNVKGDMVIGTKNVLQAGGNQEVHLSHSEPSTTTDASSAGEETAPKSPPAKDE